MEMLIGLILVVVSIEAITSIILCEDSIFHTVVWSKVQAKFQFESGWYKDESRVLQSEESKNRKVFWEYLAKFSKCNYCISFWISVAVCPIVFNFNGYLPLAILASWRLSHMFDAVYRYYLVRSFVVDNSDIEE
jgi:uncharacterized membrane protein